MTGYGSSLWGSDWYVSSPYRLNTVQYVGIKARIVKPVRSSPPIIDSIAYGLAQRFDWLQMGIQTFGLFNKIQYATGESEGIRPSLDEVWGKLYDLPRLTGESDDDYRARLQTYVQVLTGCGTAPICEAVLDFLTGYPGTARITSLWPGRALIDFTDVAAMRAIRSRISLINSILPGMFAAGIDYELLLPYIDVGISAYVLGDATQDFNIRVAIAADQEISCGIDARIAYGRDEYCSILAAVTRTCSKDIWTKAAIMAERTLEVGSAAFIQGEPSLPAYLKAAILTERQETVEYITAIQAEPELSCNYYAAIAQNFELQHKIVALITYMYEISYNIKAAVRVGRELKVGIRARIARRYE